jgi:hypothetical protein
MSGAEGALPRRVSGTARQPPFRALAAWLPLAAGLVAIVAGASVLGNTFHGDPTIYLVYARNAAAGHPFQFNTGTFSSGVASPLWSLVLTLPFVVGTGVIGAKVWTALWALTALISTTLAVRRLTASTLAATLGGAVVLPGLVYYGVMTYDSGLTVTLVSLSLVARGRWLAVLWALMLFDRPELVIVVGLEAIALGRRRHLILAAFAAIPALLYDAYSQVTLGSYSVSNAARTIDNGQLASHFGPLLISTQAIDYLVGMAPLAVIAVIGLWGRRKHALVVGASLVAFAFLLVLYPVTLYVQRYALAVMPMLALGVALAVARIRLLAIPVAGLVAVPTAAWLITASLAGIHGFTFDTATERTVVERLNSWAPANAKVLGYEVQDRWYLRPDLDYLAVNGLTDGLITPWRERGDVTGYLETYCPSIWIANDAAFASVYYRGTVLQTAYTELLAGTPSTELDGITFTVMDRPAPPLPGFAGARLVVRLDSSSCSS